MLTYIIMKQTLMIIFAALLITSSCSEKTPISDIPMKVTLSDTIRIGTQTWTSKNLDVGQFRNGDPIPEVKTDKEWMIAGNTAKPAWCYSKNDSIIGSKYGKLYNWHAVVDPRGLAPTGWHIPTAKDWTKLSVHLGGEVVAGKFMKSTQDWVEDGNGDNKSGFGGLPGGYRSLEGDFLDFGSYGNWWSSSESHESNAWYWDLRAFSSYLGQACSNKPYGMSVRCVKD